MIDFQPIEKVVLSGDEAAEYLGLDSPRGLERLVQSRRLVPLKLGKRLVYARSELDQFIARELVAERRLRGVEFEDGA